MSKSDLYSNRGVCKPPKFSKLDTCNIEKVSDFWKSIDYAPTIRTSNDLSNYLETVNYIIKLNRVEFTSKELLLIYIRHLPENIKLCLIDTNLDSALEILSIFAKWDDQITLKLKILKLMSKHYKDIQQLLLEVLPLIKRLTNELLRNEFLFLIIFPKLPMYLQYELKMFDNPNVDEIIKFINCHQNKINKFFSKNIEQKHIPNTNIFTANKKSASSTRCNKCDMLGHKQITCHVKQKTKHKIKNTEF